MEIHQNINIEKIFSLMNFRNINKTKIFNKANIKFSASFAFSLTFLFVFVFHFIYFIYFFCFHKTKSCWTWLISVMILPSCITLMYIQKQNQRGRAHKVSLTLRRRRRLSFGEDTAILMSDSVFIHKEIRIWCSNSTISVLSYTPHSSGSC